MKDVVFGRLALLHIYELILGWVLGATRTSQRSWKGLFYHFPLSQLPQIRGKHKLGLELGVLERSRWWAPRATSAQAPLVQVQVGGGLNLPNQLGITFSDVFRWFLL